MTLIFPCFHLWNWLEFNEIILQGHHRPTQRSITLANNKTSPDLLASSTTAILQKMKSKFVLVAGALRLLWYEMRRGGERNSKFQKEHNTWLKCMAWAAIAPSPNLSQRMERCKKIVVSYYRWFNEILSVSMYFPWQKVLPDLVASPCHSRFRCTKAQFFLGGHSSDMQLLPKLSPRAYEERFAIEGLICCTR